MEVCEDGGEELYVMPSPGVYQSRQDVSPLLGVLLLTHS